MKPLKEKRKYIKCR